MAASPTRTLPLGISEPLAVDNRDDRGGFIIIIAALLLGFSLVSLGIRAYVQISRHVVKFDDYILLAATLLFCGQSSAVFLQAHYGWGKSKELLVQRYVHQMLKSAYAADLLFVLAHYLSKCSAVLFYLRISPSRSQSLRIWTLVALSSAWFLISTFIVAFRCNINRPWEDITEKCSSYLVRWEVIAVLDIIIEFGIFLLSIRLVYGIQMALFRKTVVVLAFMSRLLVIIPASAHVYYLKKQLESSNPTLLGSFATICIQLELGYGILANSIPCLKPFMAAYEGAGNKPAYRSRSRSNSNSNSGSHNRSSSMPLDPNIYDVPLRSMILQERRPSAWSMFRRGSKSTTAALSEYGLRNDEANYTATITPASGEQNEHGKDCDDEQRLIIKKDLKWRVERAASADQTVTASPDKSRIA